MGQSEGAGPGPAGDSAPTGAVSGSAVAGLPSEGASGERKGRIVPLSSLKWASVPEVEARSGEEDERSPVERLDSAGSVSRGPGGRFVSAAKVADVPTESQGKEVGAAEAGQAVEAVSALELGGKKFRDAREASEYLTKTAGRASAEAKRANTAEGRLKEALEVIRQYETITRDRGLVDEAGVLVEPAARTSRGVDPGEGKAAAEAAGVPESLIDAVDWDVVGRFAADPKLGPAYAIAAAMKSVDSVMAARLEKLEKAMDAKYQEELGFISEGRKAEEGMRLTADFIASQRGVLSAEGASKYPELTGEPEKVRGFVRELVSEMDEIGERAFSPRGFEIAVRSVRQARASLGGDQASRSTDLPRLPSAASVAARERAAAGAVSGGEAGGVGPAVQANNPSADVVRRIREAGSRTTKGWALA